MSSIYDERPDFRPGRRRAARPLADIIGPAIEDACRRRGFASSEIVTLWPEIVDSALARRSRPECIKWPRRMPGDDGPRPGTLVVRCDGAGAMVISHQAPVIIERVNALFGWRAVERVRVVQRPPPPEADSGRRRLRPLAPQEDAHLAGMIGEETPAPLASALRRLGRGVIGASPRREPSA
ncbi:hypothetical protein SAMN02745172_00169 [Pseudoxanthobacter soli DSM 19599]|uniref:DUF721 domain-containing protein n=1 Tax=Pseudoxanthobacter soli DSM 19599 TaxID=1123029 RepID=A0A1M7Z5M0_9HYPH|nr:DciA family protein [Pseudoxanthobacter soli]SHO60080.1 hypothetical protein SAMN02745172_00169 [Pseudoxanthobacter soli DSM 19599]